MVQYYSLSSLSRIVDETERENQTKNKTFLTEDFRFIDILRSSQLVVPDEDSVFDFVAYLSSILPASVSQPLWESIRYIYLSNDYIETWIRPLFCEPAVEQNIFVVEESTTPTNNFDRSIPSSAAMNGSLKIPIEVYPYIRKQLDIRDERIRKNQSSGYKKFGCCLQQDIPSVQPHNTTFMDARDSYCFTLDIYGTNQKGTGGGLFYVWINPDDPLGNNNVDDTITNVLSETKRSVTSTTTHPRVAITNLSISEDTISQSDHPPLASTISSKKSSSSTESSVLSFENISSVGESTVHSIPNKYIHNIQGWETKYRTKALIFNGKQCALAVKEISTYPEFHLPISIRLPSLHHIYNFQPENATKTNSSVIHLTSLWDIYQYYARTGKWIQCVDIARLCILWLMGSNSLYMDTDVEPGESFLPLELFRPSDDASFLSSSRPLLIIPQDMDGVLQNNVLGLIGGSRGSAVECNINDHELRTRYELSLTNNPCNNHGKNPFLTLLLQSILVNSVYENHVIHATGPALFTALFHIFRNINVHISAYIKQIYGKENRNNYNPLFLTTDMFMDRIQSQLPRVEESDYTFSLSRVYQTSFGMHPPMNNEEKDNPKEDNEHVALLRPLDQWKYGEFIHVLPSTAFFPTHWRKEDSRENRSGNTTDLLSTGTEKIVNVSLCNEAQLTNTVNSAPINRLINTDRPFTVQFPTVTTTVPSRVMNSTNGNNDSQSFPLPLPPATVGFGPMVSYSRRYTTFAPTGTATEGITLNAERQLLQLRITNNQDPNENNNNNNHNNCGTPSSFREDKKESVPSDFTTPYSMVPESNSTNNSPPVINYGHHKWDCTWGKGNTGYYLKNSLTTTTKSKDIHFGPDQSSKHNESNVQGLNSVSDATASLGYASAVTVVYLSTGNVQTTPDEGRSSNDNSNTSLTPRFKLPSVAFLSENARLLLPVSLPLIARGSDVFNVAALGYRTLYRMTTNDFVSFLPAIPPGSLIQSLFPRITREYRLSYDK